MAFTVEQFKQGKRTWQTTNKQTSLQRNGQL